MLLFTKVLCTTLPLHCIQDNRNKTNGSSCMDERNGFMASTVSSCINAVGKSLKLQISSLLHIVFLCVHFTIFVYNVWRPSLPGTCVSNSLQLSSNMHGHATTEPRCTVVAERVWYFVLLKYSNYQDKGQFWNLLVLKISAQGNTSNMAPKPTFRR